MAKRRPLPDTRKSVTHTVMIYDGAGDCTLTIRVGFYPRGKPGELSIQVAKQGSTMRGFCEVIGHLVSYALQYGVPLGDLCHKLKAMTFAPDGETSNEEIPDCASIIDYLFTWVEQRFGPFDEREPSSAPAEAGA